MHAISDPRIFCSSGSGSFAKSIGAQSFSTREPSAQSLPAFEAPALYSTEPSTICAPGHGSSRRIPIAVTLLPQPDSPTSAKNSPALISNETRSVTCNGLRPSTGKPFLLNPKATESPRTCKTGEELNIPVPRLRVHGIPHALAHERGEEQRHKQCGDRAHRNPRRIKVVESLAHEFAPAGRGRLQAEP